MFDFLFMGLAMLFGRWHSVVSYLGLDLVPLPLACRKSSPDFTRLDLLAGEVCSGISSMFRLALFLKVFGDCEDESRALDALPRVLRTDMPAELFCVQRWINRKGSFPSASATETHGIVYLGRYPWHTDTASVTAFEIISRDLYPGQRQAAVYR